MRSVRLLSILFFALLWHAASALAAPLPSKPTQYVTDEAKKLSPAVRQTLNRQLEQFEKDTSNQVLVAVYPNLPRGQELADYSIRTANAWQVGQKDKRNGVVLFIFVNDRRMFIATGYGLEGALPDATCQYIIDHELKPRFRVNDYDGGIKAGVNAIIAATKGEYKGKGKTANQKIHDNAGNWVVWAVVALFIFIVIGNTFFGGGTTYTHGRRRRSSWGPWIISTGGWSGGSSGGGWGSGGGGGGFSSGGGSFGGGGAGGSW